MGNVAGKTDASSMRVYFACRRDSHTLYPGYASYQTLHCLKHSLCSRRSIGRDFPPREKMAFFQNCHFDISPADIYTCSFHKSLIFMKRKRHLHWPTSRRIFRLNALCACCAYKISQSKRYNACSGVVQVTGVEPARTVVRESESNVTLVKTTTVPLQRASCCYPEFKRRAST